MKENRNKKRKQVESVILFKSEGGGNYLYSKKNNQILLIHPVLDYLIQLDQNDNDVKNWFETLDNGDIHIENYGHFSKEIVIHYYNKFKLLSENGYFDKVDHANRISGRLNKKTVKSNFINTSSVVFEVTQNCNLNCVYCGYGKYYNDYEKRNRRSLCPKIAKKYLDSLFKLWNVPEFRSFIKEVDIGFYGGEPLLNIDFIKEITQYVKKFDSPNIIFTFGMTTNGTLLHKYMDFLVENNFKLLISLDGYERNNEFRVYKNGRSPFKTIIKNVRYLQEKYPGYFEKMVNFNSVLHNKNSVEEIVDFFIKNFNKMPNISELNSDGIDPKKKVEFLKFFKKYQKSINQVKDFTIFKKNILRVPEFMEAFDVIMNYCGFIYKDFSSFYFSPENRSFIPTSTCVPFYKRTFITAYGTVLPCERVSHKYAFGVVDENRIDINFQQITDKYNEYYDKIKNQCFTCYNAKKCGICLLTIGIDGDKPICNGHMDYDAFSNYLGSIISTLEKNSSLYKKLIKEVSIS